MRHRIEAGKDPFVVFVADAPDGRGDLYAMTPSGGEVVQLTFSLPAEWGPNLSPHGDVVAFIRSRNESDTTNARVSLLNLLNGAERGLRLPDSSGAPRRVAWDRDGRALFVETTTSVYRIAAPPARPVAEEVTGAAAEAAFALKVGNPAFARIEDCEKQARGEGQGARGELCVVPDSGTPVPLAPGARDATRWGDDSLAYIQGGELVVRPLGPGHPRTVRFRGVTNPRQVTVFAGPVNK